MCCGRKTPRRTGKRSNLIKKPQQSENSPAVVPEVPEQPRQELEYNKIEEQKQEEI
jgi:hypothetical protein